MDDDARRVEHAPQRRRRAAARAPRGRGSTMSPGRRPRGSPPAPARARRARPPSRAAAARPRACSSPSSRSTDGRSRSSIDVSLRSGRRAARPRAGARRGRPLPALRSRARCSWSIGSSRTPAATFVTHEIARQRIPMCRAASTSGTVDMPTRSAPSVAHHADLGWRLEGGPEPGGVDALAERRGRAAPPRPAASARSPGRMRRTCRGARPERLVVRADERRGALEVEVVGDRDEAARHDGRVERAAGVREHEPAHPEPAEHAHAEDDLRRRDAPRRGGRGLSSRDGHAAELRHQRPRVPDRGRAGRPARG